MLAKAVFVIVLILFSFASFFVDLPPGTIVTEQMSFTTPEFRFFTNNLVNGIVFGAFVAVAVFLVSRHSKPRYTPSSSISTSVSSALDEIDEMMSDVNETKSESDLTEIKGIGNKRALELEIAGVKTISDLAKRSPKHLAEKTGIPITQISKWIVEANKMQK